MRFGVGLFTAEALPGDSRASRDLYREVIEYARIAEDSGLDSFWISEHHFDPEGYMPSVFAVAGAVGSVTSRLRLTVGVPAGLHHPLRLAEDFATLDCLTSGRVTVLLGAGTRQFEHAVLGINRDTAAERRTETLQILSKAFKASPFEFSGRHFSFPSVVVTPTCFTVGGPPILLGGVDDSSLGLDPSLHRGFVLDSALEWSELVRLTREVRKKGPGLELAIQSYGFITQSGDPWEVIRKGFLHLRRKYNAWTGRGGVVNPSPTSYRLLLGTPEAVADNLLEYLDALDAPVEFVLRLSYPGLDAATVAAALGLFGQVANLVRARLRTLTPS